MGTGASKKATADAEKASFDDDDTDEDFDTYSKKKVAANSKSFSRHSVTMFPISVHSKFLGGGASSYVVDMICPSG